MSTKDKRDERYPGIVLLACGQRRLAETPQLIDCAASINYGLELRQAPATVFTLRGRFWPTVALP